MEKIEGSQNLNSIIQASHEIVSFMERSKDSLENVFEITPSILCIIDTRGRVLKGNLSLAQAMGTTLSRMIGVSIFELFDESYQEKFTQTMESLQPGETRELEIPFHFEKRTLTHYSWHIKAMPQIVLPNDFAFLVIAASIERIKVYQKTIENLFEATKRMASARKQVEVAEIFLTTVLNNILGISINQASFIQRDLNGIAPIIRITELSILSEKLDVSLKCERAGTDSDFLPLSVLKNSRVGTCENGKKLLVSICQVKNKECFLQLDSNVEIILSEEGIAFIDGLAVSAEIALSNIQFTLSATKMARQSTELEAISLIQTALLPAQDVHIPGVNFESIFQPAAEAGGDLFGHHYDVSLNTLFVYILDVTGHGIPSALITGVIFGALFGGQKIASNDQKTDAKERLLAICELANHAVCAVGRGEFFATMNILSLELHSGEINFINAGHTIPFHMRADGSIARFKGSGSRLGFNSKTTFQIDTYHLKRGDKLCLFTDGILENIGNSGRFFSERKFKSLLELQQPLSKTKKALAAALEEHMHGVEPGDDASILLMEWCAPAQSKHSA